MSVIDDASDRIRARVLSGRVAPGDRLPELPLAAQLGVSRASVREALRRLQSEGLLRSDGRGLLVAGLDDRERRSAFVTRAHLEGLHAALAAERVRAGEIAPAQLRRLQELADAADASTRAGDGATAANDNRALHQAIDALADNPVGAAVLDGLWDRLIAATARSLLAPGRPDTVDAEHRAILAAIAGGRPKRARVAARDHVLATLGGGRAAGVDAASAGSDR